jgi:uncharacterized membrane protein
MTLGEILDRTAELYRNRFSLFAGLSALFAAAMLAIQMAHLGVLALIGYPHIPAQREWIYAVMIGVELLAISLVAGLSIAAFSRAVAWIHLNETATIRAAAKSVFTRPGRYIWLMAVTMFRAWAPLFALYVALFAIIFSVLPAGFLFNPQLARLAPSTDPQTLVTAGIAMLVLLPLLLGAAIYGVLMWLRYSLAMPACVVENLPAGRAIKRSVELSKSSRGRLFILWLLVYAVRMLLGVLLGFPFLLYSFKHPGQTLPLGWLALSELAGFVTNTLIGPIYSTGLTLFYYDQRIRKEGFDIEWMMQAAGLTPPALAAPSTASEPAALPATVEER